MPQNIWLTTPEQAARPNERFLLRTGPRSIASGVHLLLQLRAARELEDLRLEKESLQVMKQQLAAVHQLRIDLQRKDSVIQARVEGKENDNLTLKVRSFLLLGGGGLIKYYRGVSQHNLV